MGPRALPLLLALTFGCQGETVGEEGSGGSAGSGAQAATGGASSGGASSGGAGGGVSGPGAHGSLPTGYCCTTDSECRYRNCRDFGGVKMCSDWCSTQDSTCNSAPNMKCDKTAEECVPAGTPTCLPANQWTSGTTPIGGCCIATGDGHAGEECQGNLCAAFGDLSNPFICTHACDAPKDCPPKYECNAFTKSCWPLATIYDCQ